MHALVKSGRALARRGTSLVTTVGLLGVVAGCGGAAPPPQQAPPPAQVEIITLAAKPLEQFGEFVGTVKSRRSTTIQPQAEGFLTAIRVKSGDRVKQGTLLFEIDATTQQAAVASLESVRAAREADAAFARQAADRARKLLAAGAMSQQEVEQAAAQQKAAEAQLRAIEEQIRAQRAELAFHRVVSPTDGVVGDVPVRVGDRVTRMTMLTTVDDNTGLELYVNVPVQEGPRMKVGLPLKLLNEAGEVIATDKVEFISPSVSEDTQTVLVKAPLASKPGMFRADQFVRVRIIWATAPGITVPVTAVNRINGQYFAFVAEPGKDGGLVARQRQLTLGPVLGNEYIVVSGLTEGTKLIVSGVQKIFFDGAPVVAAPPGAPPAPAGRGREGK